MISRVFKLFLSGILVIIVTLSSAQDYSVSNIPKELREGANAVMRLDEMEFTIYSSKKATKKVHYVVTILNSKANSHAKVYLGYDKLQTINYLSGKIIDQNGKEVKRIKKNEIRDYSSYDGSIYSDNRLKYLDLRYPQYPYTIEIEYEKSYNGLLYYPSWTAQKSAKTAVENSTFKVIFPLDQSIRFKSHLIEDPIITNYAGNSMYFWKTSKLKAFDPDPMGKNFKEYVPNVKIAPDDFEIEGYAGNMASWKEFGHWINLLNKNLQNLPEETVSKLKNLTAGLNAVDKIKTIYNYLQANTRYVSVQLGIGGWKPFAADFVDEKGYGDCKALTNYTMSLLKEIGIKSYYTLVLAGDNAPNIDSDFPSTQFNHVILSVPMANDTIWLECTSQTNPFGYLGRFTGDRDVLVINDEGGTIVHTPLYGLVDNQQIRTAEIIVDQEGNAKANITTVYKGLQSENGGLDFIVEKNDNEQLKWLSEHIDIPSFEIDAFNFDYQKEIIPSITESLDLNLRRLVSKSGKRMFLNLNLMIKNSYIPSSVKDRKTDVVRRMSFFDSDSLVYHLPDGYRVEFQPERITIESPFGEYKSAVKIEDNKVTYIRTLKMIRGRFPASEYEALREFYKKIAKADKLSLVLINST